MGDPRAAPYTGRMELRYRFLLFAAALASLLLLVIEVGTLTRPG